jgi:hypothetical protein
MQVLRLTVILATWLAALPALGTPWAEKMFESRRHEFGSVAAGALAEYQFVFKNIYREDVHVASVRSSCGCTMPRIKDDKRTYKTWETGAIVARINSAAFRGHRGATVTVTIDRPYYATVQLQVKVNIHGELVFKPGSVQFGAVDQGAGVTRVVEVTTPYQSSLRVSEVRNSNPHLSAELTPVNSRWGNAGYQLRVHLGPDTPPGHLKDQLVLVTTGYRRLEVPLTVDALVLPQISVSPESLDLGVVHAGETVERRVVVRGKTPFTITNAPSNSAHFKLDASGASTAKPLHVLPVEFVAGDEPGKVSHTFYLQTDQEDQTAQIVASAVVAPGSEAKNDLASDGSPSP